MAPLDPLALQVLQLPLLLDHFLLVELELARGWLELLLSYGLPRHHQQRQQFQPSSRIVISQRTRARMSLWIVCVNAGSHSQRTGTFSRRWR